MGGQTIGLGLGPVVPSAAASITAYGLPVILDVAAGSDADAAAAAAALALGEFLSRTRQMFDSLSWYVGVPFTIIWHLCHIPFPQALPVRIQNPTWIATDHPTRSSRR